MTTPTWGYHPTKPAEIFELAKGERLPAGWYDSPAAIPSGEDVERADSIADLTMQLQARGVDVDGRWGVGRLKRELRKARG